MGGGQRKGEIRSLEDDGSVSDLVWETVEVVEGGAMLLWPSTPKGMGSTESKEVGELRKNRELDFFYDQKKKNILAQFVCNIFHVLALIFCDLWHTLPTFNRKSMRAVHHGHSPPLQSRWVPAARPKDTVIHFPLLFWFLVLVKKWEEKSEWIVYYAPHNKHSDFLALNLHPGKEWPHCCRWDFKNLSPCARFDD